jgi:catechol 2,3-dioxygenase-like lactoylglutathione lyase family enzyme
MIDHIGIGCGDFAASQRFYEAALAPLGISKMMELTPEMTGGYHGVGMGAEQKPFFWFGNDGPRGTGMHVAFAAETRAQVDAFYAAAMANGGRDNGPPGIRAHYHPNYYGAFVLDADGHNIEAVCHKPE